MSELISVEDRLPTEGKYVVGLHNRSTWIDKSDPEKVRYVVVRLCRGISLAQREALPDSSDRKGTWISSDEGSGNNKRPYHWEVFGPGSFFGQEITHWMPLPPTPTTIHS